MNFKKTIPLFILIFCALGAKSTLAMNKLAKAITNLEAQQKAQDLDNKKKKLWLDLFDKAFDAEDSDKSLKYFKEIMKFIERLKFKETPLYSKCKRKNADFLKKILKDFDDASIHNPMKELDSKIKKAYEDRNIAVCVNFLREKIEFFGGEIVVDEEDIFKKDIQDKEFRSKCWNLFKHNIHPDQDQQADKHVTEEEAKKRKLDQSYTESGKKIDDVIDKSKEELLNKFEEAFKRKDAQACHEYLFVIYYNFERDEVDDFCRMYNEMDAAFFKHIIDLRNRIAPTVHCADTENDNENKRQQELKKQADENSSKLNTDEKNKLSKCLIKVARSGDYNLFKKLLIDGANKDYVNEEGFAVVHIVAFFGPFEKVKALADYGADLTVKTNNGAWNVLHLINDGFESCKINLVEAAKIIRLVLINCNQLMTEEDNQGRRPIDLFLANDIGTCLKNNGIIDKDGMVLI